jgi:circadian clock protein KaiC
MTFASNAAGMVVYPRLVAADHRHEISAERFPTGISALDSLLGGGLDAGSSTLIVGSAGTGKSTLAAQFCANAADRGKTAAMFIFDESIETLLRRAAGLTIDLRKHYESGRVTIQQIDPAELSPGEFAHRLRRAAEEHQAAVVVIDSLNGYLNAMPEERFLINQLHEILMYLGRQGVATVLVGAHQGLIGTQMITPVDASYLADSVILLRYFEAEGEVRQAISVVKKRGGAHEKAIREFQLKDGRIVIGEPLRGFRGVLTGVPTVVGGNSTLTEGTKK